MARLVVLDKPFVFDGPRGLLKLEPRDNFHTLPPGIDPPPGSIILNSLEEYDKHVKSRRQQYAHRPGRSDKVELPERARGSERLEVVYDEERDGVIEQRRIFIRVPEGQQGKRQLAPGIMRKSEQDARRYSKIVLGSSYSNLLRQFIINYINEEI